MLITSREYFIHYPAQILEHDKILVDFFVTENESANEIALSCYIFEKIKLKCTENVYI